MLMSSEQWWLFIVACTVLNTAPGPDTIYITTKTITQGRLSGMLSALGVCTGAMVHATAAGIGLSAILATSAYAFTIVKWVGALYLMYLGYRAIASTLKGEQQMIASQPKTEPTKNHLWKIYFQGVLVDILNPKTAMFFLAFIPQFINPSSGSSVWQFIFLGLVVIINALVIEVVLIMFASKITGFLHANKSLSNWLERSLGLTLIGLGLHLIRGKV
jgi:threonine/homoserine/homoserine lactone efflux protein